MSRRRGLLIAGSDPGGALFPLTLAPIEGIVFADELSQYVDDGATLVSADGDAVYRINDQTANSIDYKQATLASRPLYKEGITEGFPAGLFDGVDDCMDSPVDSNMESDVMTFSGVFKTGANITGPLVLWVAGFSSGAGSSSGNLIQIFVQDSLVYFLWRASAGTAILVSQPVVANTLYRFICEKENDASDSIAITVNGGAEDTNTGATGSPSGHIKNRFGARIASPFFYYGGYVVELWIYDKLLSAGEKTQMDTYQQRYFP